MTVPGRECDGDFSKGRFQVPDPFAPSEILNAILATALFRCWHLILFFTAWSTVVTVLNNRGFNFNVDSSLLTVIGTVLGFVISYRTTSSFERYNEGRRLWSQIILTTRNFARAIWFHIPDSEPVEGQTARQTAASMLVEKKTVINLLGAFAVAVKHYLRGEDGIYYEDLYHHVKFLSAYALPAGRPEQLPSRQTTAVSSDWPYPKTLRERGKSNERQSDNQIRQASLHGKRLTLRREDEGNLWPARDPPKHHFFYDLFRFSILIPALGGRATEGKEAARMRAKLQGMAVSHNIPLELSFYLSSYIATVQRRAVCDHPTIANLTTALNTLVDSLTGLERILTTPIPFSYAAHLWSVTTIYCLLLPVMVWPALHWATIPATAIVTFLFFGFLVAGEEIENPFGYDKNDLNLDHFTNNIIRDELRAITSMPPPDIARWAFVPENDCLVADHGGNAERIAPSQWVERGVEGIMQSLGSRFPPSAPHSVAASTVLGDPVNLCASPVGVVNEDPGKEQ